MPEGFSISFADGLPLETTRIMPGVGFMTDDERASLMNARHIKHAAIYGPVAALAGAAAASLCSGLTVPPERLGLLVNGGPWAIDPSLRLLERARDAGPAYINPSHFPATLVSAVPTTVSAAVRAKAFAFAAGHDRLAFFEVLRRARQALTHGLADAVLTLGVCAPPAILLASLRFRGIDPRTPDVSAGFLITKEQRNGMMLVDAGVGDGAAGETTAISDGDTRPSPEQHGLDMLSAVGAALCARLFSESDRMAPGEERIVELRAGSRRGYARFRHR